MGEGMSINLGQLFGGDNGPRWMKHRKMIHYEGAMWVLLGVDWNGSNGVFVTSREEYATRNPSSIKFIPAEFLCDVYPDTKGKKNVAIELPNSGNAAHQGDDELTIQVSAATSPEDAHIWSHFEKSVGKYPYPELTELGETMLDLDISRAVGDAVIRAKVEGKTNEETDKIARKVAQEAMSARRKRMGIKEGDEEENS